jgi:hypothetical protein
MYRWTKVEMSFFLQAPQLIILPPSTAPILAEMRLNLLDAKMSTSGIQGSVTWLIEGISIEDAQ